MGKSSRDDFHKAQVNPGPGSYQPRSSFEGSKFHFGGRYGESKKDTQPGPGQYNPDFRMKQSALGYSIAGRCSTAPRGTGVPGPGCYNVQPEKQKISGRFGKDSRKYLNQSGNVAPGPGAYDSKTFSGNKATAPHFT